MAKFTEDIVRSKFTFTGDFEAMVWFYLLSQPLNNSWWVGMIYERATDPTNYYIGVGASFTGGLRVFRNIRKTGAAESATTRSRPAAPDGLLRISRHGRYVRTYIKRTARAPRWRQVGVPYLFDYDGKISFKAYGWDNNPVVSCQFDNFRVARGCSVIQITSTTTTTTTV